MHHPRFYICGLMLLVNLANASAQPAARPSPRPSDDPQPTDAADAIESIHVPDGYEVQLVASEPLVVDPVAIDWGADGKLWVVEMADYPLGMDGEGKPGGRVRFLVDSDDDGKYDQSTMFAERLPFPTGVLSWGDGILVTAAPEILYLEDSTGDGKADVRRVLYSGFLEGNQQLRVNGLRWGLDNWVYCASGSHHAGYGKGNQIVSTLTGRKHQIGSRDFRIRPDSGEMDPQSGPSQYGRNRDDWGNWFGVQNSHPLWHYVLADQNIRRNPHFAPPDPKQQIVTPANPPVYPASKLQKRFHSFQQSGRFTSACSAIIYRDNLLFPPGDAQHAFTCEPFHNLVQHNLIFDDGVSFRFRRDETETELDFFASEDRWCRPVMVRTGPRGGLWVVDMYRYMIEHPQWLPQTGKDELRPWYRLGDDRGRIFRVVPKNQPAAGPVRLEHLTPKQWVAQLESPNGWRRDLAQRQLLRDKAPETIQPLRELAVHGQLPQARLHALWTLQGLGVLPSPTLQTALNDGHPGVRRGAVQIASLVRVDPGALAGMVDDPDAKVRLELASTLGAYADPIACDALAALATRSADHPYITAAVFSSLNQENVAAVLDGVAKSIDSGNRELLIDLVGQAVALGDHKQLADVFEIACASGSKRRAAWQYRALARVLDELEKQDWQPAENPSHRDPIGTVIAQARTDLANPSAPEELRVAASALLARDVQQLPSDLALMQGILIPQSPAPLQRAIVQRLATRAEPEVAEILLAGWRSYGPMLRGEIVSVLASRPTWAERLRQHLESGLIMAGQLPATVRQQLLAAGENSNAWKSALAVKASQNRMEVVRRYQPSLHLDGDVKQGAIIFRKLCLTCHQAGGQGHEVGPNLASVTNKSKEALLMSILDPSAAVEAKYFSYTALTDDGRVSTGMLATETGSSITLLAAEGKRHTILRDDIESLTASPKSLMPDGLEEGLKPQDLADLMEFVQKEIR